MEGQEDTRLGRGHNIASGWRSRIVVSGGVAGSCIELGLRGRTSRLECGRIGGDSDMIEDAPDGAGLSDERDDEAAVAAGVAAEHVVPEDALHELGPGIARVAGVFA